MSERRWVVCRAAPSLEKMIAVVSSAALKKISNHDIYMMCDSVIMTSAMGSRLSDWELTISSSRLDVSVITYKHLNPEQTSHLTWLMNGIIAQWVETMIQRLDESIDVIDWSYYERLL